jgi:uncharacterized protein
MAAPASHKRVSLETGRLRLRPTHVFLNDNGECDFFYDIERTFVIEVPKEIRRDIIPAIERGRMASTVAGWLMEEDVLTADKPVSRAPGASPSLPTLTDFSLDISGDCNLRCDYCFEKDIHARGGPMSEETMASTLDLIFRECADSETITLHFGSGEPLLNFKLLRKIVKEAGSRANRAGKNIFYELTTNGTLVNDEVRAFFKDNPFVVKVSCDGPQAINDRTRLWHERAGSYDSVVKGIRLLLSAIPDRLSVNTVVCGGTRLTDLWKWIRELGVLHYLTIKVGATSSLTAMSPGGKELDDYRSDLAFICDDILKHLKAGRTPVDFQPVTKIIRRLMGPRPVTKFCGVAGTYLGVASNGEIYPCFRHLGLEQYNFGSVTGGVDHAGRRHYLSHEAADVDIRKDCRDCWARYLCGGACYADMIVYGLEKLKPYAPHCDFWRIEVESSIRLYHELLQTNPSYCLTLVGADKDNFHGLRGTIKTGC